MDIQTTVWIDKELLKQFKKWCIDHNISMSKKITELVKKEVKTE